MPRCRVAPDGDWLLKAMLPACTTRFYLFFDSLNMSSPPSVAVRRVSISGELLQPLAYAETFDRSDRYSGYLGELRHGSRRPPVLPPTLSLWFSCSLILPHACPGWRTGNVLFPPPSNSWSITASGARSSASFARVLPDSGWQSLAVSGYTVGCRPCLDAARCPAGGHAPRLQDPVTWRTPTLSCKGADRLTLLVGLQDSRLSASEENFVTVQAM
jgi:hypothetical protein